MIKHNFCANFTADLEIIIMAIFSFLLSICKVLLMPQRFCFRKLDATHSPFLFMLLVDIFFIFSIEKSLILILLIYSLFGLPTFRAPLWNAIGLAPTHSVFMILYAINSVIWKSGCLMFGGFLLVGILLDLGSICNFVVNSHVYKIIHHFLKSYFINVKDARTQKLLHFKRKN